MAYFGNKIAADGAVAPPKPSVPRPSPRAHSPVNPDPYRDPATGHRAYVDCSEIVLCLASAIKDLMFSDLAAWPSAACYCRKCETGSSCEQQGPPLF